MRKVLIEGDAVRKVLIEGATILVSILVAFGLQAAWETSQERAAERRALATVLAEINGNLGRLAEANGIQAANYQNSARLLDYSPLSVRETDPDSLDRFVEAVTHWEEPANWAQGAVDALLAGGNIQAIESDAVRASLSALPREFEFTRQEERAVYDFIRNSVVAHIRENGNLHQISSSEDPTPQPQPTEPMLYSGPRFDHASLVASREFQGLILQKWWYEQGVLDAYAELRVRLLEVRAGVCATRYALCAAAP